MAMYKQYNLPFEVERACRCSFVVRLADGEHAFISNENLLRMMANPDTPTRTILKRDQRGMDQKWILVQKMEWDLGFKPRIFGPNGVVIR